jgi:hypothetical protein
MAATYTPIQTYTLVSNTGVVTFSSIAGYDDLRLTIQGGHTNNGYLLGMRFNGATSVYSYQTLWGTSGNAYGGIQYNNFVFAGINNQTPNNTGNAYCVDLFNYSDTNMFKTYISRTSPNTTSGTNGHMDLTSGSWLSKTAITSIAISEVGSGGTGTWNTGSILAGTTLTLWGIKRA